MDYSFCPDLIGELVRSVMGTCGFLADLSPSVKPPKGLPEFE
jgi:hypothetical protein